jgi:hypothetical protein
MKTLHLAAPLACLIVLVGCSKKDGEASAEGGATAAASGDTATKAASADGPAFHCFKKKIARCEQTTAAQMAAAKAKLESGTPEEKKFAGLMTLDGFKSMCGTGEYGEGACATENAVGACVSVTGKNIYYGGDDGYKPDEFAYECNKDATPESADGKPMPKPAAQRMSCNRTKDSTCIEDDFKGKSSRLSFCTPSAFAGPAELTMGPCPTEKRSASCKDAPMTFGGETRQATRITYAYGAKAAAKTKSICGIMKGEFTKL